MHVEEKRFCEASQKAYERLQLHYEDIHEIFKSIEVDNKPDTSEIKRIESIIQKIHQFVQTPPNVGYSYYDSLLKIQSRLKTQLAKSNNLDESCFEEMRKLYWLKYYDASVYRILELLDTDLKSLAAPVNPLLIDFDEKKSNNNSVFRSLREIIIHDMAKYRKYALKQEALLDFIASHLKSNFGEIIDKIIVQLFEKISKLKQLQKTQDVDGINKYLNGELMDSLTKNLKIPLMLKPRLDRINSIINIEAELKNQLIGTKSLNNMVINTVDDLLWIKTFHKFFIQILKYLKIIVNRCMEVQNVLGAYDFAIKSFEQIEEIEKAQEQSLNELSDFITKKYGDSGIQNFPESVLENNLVRHVIGQKFVKKQYEFILQDQKMLSEHMSTEQLEKVEKSFFLIREEYEKTLEESKITIQHLKADLDKRKKGLP